MTKKTSFLETTYQNLKDTTKEEITLITKSKLEKNKINQNKAEGRK